MKILLTLIICSQVAGTCMDPYQWTETFNSQYDCLIFGYEESINKIINAIPILSVITILFLVLHALDAHQVCCLIHQPLNVLTNSNS